MLQACAKESEGQEADVIIPPKVSKRYLLVRAGCILEFCERLAYYSIVSNLVLFFINNLGYQKGTANIITLVWSGTCYVTPLLGGWIADSFWGRFKTIIVFVIIYIIGLIGLTVGAIDGYDSEYPAIALTALFVIALGGIKPNVVTFGADQFGDLDVSPEEAESMKQTFFNWFYFSINLGSAISYTAIAYVQQNISFTVGLAVPTGFMGVSAILFVIGYRWYRVLPPSGSVIGRGTGVVYASCSAPEEVKNASSDFWERAKVYPTKPTGEPVYGSEEVDSIKSFVKILPIFSTFIIFCVFFTQGTVLDLQLGSFVIPVASLHIFNALGILVLVPLFDRILYPLLKKYNVAFGMLKRIGCGFCLASIGMIYAGLLEVYRLYLFSEGHWFKQKIGELEVIAVDLTILAQAPAYLFIAAGEVLASITGLEFAYSQAPPNMRSLVLAIFYLTSASGNYLGSLIVTVVNAATSPHKWIGDDLNHSHLDLYFFLLAALGFINVFYYIFVSSGYQIQSPTKKSASSDEVLITGAVGQSSPVRGDYKAKGEAKKIEERESELLSNFS